MLYNSVDLRIIMKQDLMQIKMNSKERWSSPSMKQV